MAATVLLFLYFSKKELYFPYCKEKRAKRRKGQFVTHFSDEFHCILTSLGCAIVFKSSMCQHMNMDMLLT